MTDRNLKQKAYQALRIPGTPNQLSKRIGGTPSTISTLLKELMDEGLVERVRKGDNAPYFYSKVRRKK